MITNRSYYVDLTELSDKNLMFDFAKEMYFDEKVLGNISTRDKKFVRLLRSHSIMVSVSGVSSSHKKKPFSKPHETIT